MAKEATIQFQRIKSLKENETYRIITTTLPDGTIVSQSIADTILYYGEPLYIEDTKYLVIGNGRIVYDSSGTKKFADGSKTVKELIDSKEYYQIAKAPTFEDATLIGTTTISGTKGNYVFTIDSSTATNEIANTAFVQNAIYRASQVFIGDTAPTINPPVAGSDYFAIWIDTSNGKQTLRYQNADTTTKEWPSFDSFEVSYDQIVDGQLNVKPLPSNDLPLMDGTAAAGTSTAYSRTDHVHPTDTALQEEIAKKANSKDAALTGTPIAPTATAGTKTTQIATTEFVATATTKRPATTGTIYITGVTTQDGDLYYNTTGSNNKSGIRIDCAKGVLLGAAWNDFAEYRKCNAEPGTVVCEAGDGSLAISNKKLQPGAAVISDTYGIIIGLEKQGYAPIAVAGRVLVKYSGNKAYYKVGDPVCATKNGCITKMNRLETILFPDRILGYISEIPTYLEWNKIKINDRLWIKII